MICTVTDPGAAPNSSVTASVIFFISLTFDRAYDRRRKKRELRASQYSSYFRNISVATDLNSPNFAKSSDRVQATERSGG